MERPKGAFCYYQGASFGAPSPLKRGDQLKSNSRGGARTKSRGCLKCESRIFGMRGHTLAVVPAKAGTHTPCVIVLALEAKAFCNTRCQGLWVPAFAGTTQN